MNALLGFSIAIGFCIAAIGFFIAMTWALKRYEEHNRDEWKHKKHPDLALIALPVVYIQAHEDGVIIQDSKQRLHYFSKHRGYSWEPLENIEL